jgi:spore germination protein GerM
MVPSARTVVAVLVVLLVLGVGLTVYVLVTPVCLKCATFAETTTVRAFFLNDTLDPEVTCTEVFPVDREVPKTGAVGRAALDELLAGLTEAERTLGYSTALPDGVAVNRLAIEDGTAYADFDATLERGAGGSCRVAAIRWQIIETLKQFPTVHEVVISIDGNSEDILQP